MGRWGLFDGGLLLCCNGRGCRRLIGLFVGNSGLLRARFCWTFCDGAESKMGVGRHSERVSKYFKIFRCFDQLFKAINLSLKREVSTELFIVRYWKDGASDLKDRGSEHEEVQGRSSDLPEVELSSVKVRSL